MANEQRSKICSFRGMKCKNVQRDRQHDHVCVYSVHRQILPYTCSSLSKESLLTATWGLPFFTLSSIPTRGLPGGLFPIILPSIINGTRWPCRRVWLSQTLNNSQYFIITDFVRPVMFKTFLQSHISQLSKQGTSSFFKLHNSAPYRRVL